MPASLLRLAAIAAAAAATFALRSAAEARRPPPDSSFGSIASWFPPEVAKPFSFGMSPLAADLAYLQAVQVHGARKTNVPSWEGAGDDRALGRLLDYATELDPRFCGAYRFAASALPRHTTDGKAMNVLIAVQLLARGMENCPDDWRIPFLLGFMQSFYLGKMSDAARSMAEASRRANAPRFVGFLATRLAADAGSLDLGEKLAAAMEAEATEDATRAAWHERLLDLRMERHLREIEAAAARYARRAGHEAPSLQALVASGDLPRVPEEPHGGHYQLLPDGQAASSAMPRLRVRGRVGTQSGLLAQ